MSTTGIWQSFPSKTCLPFHDYQVFVKLIRRYKYLERAFEDEMKKVLMYTKGFKPEQRTKLADVTAVSLAQVGSALGLPSFFAHPPPFWLNLSSLQEI